MSQVCSIFSQLLKLFPRSEFEQAVRQHGWTSSGACLESLVSARELLDLTSIAPIFDRRTGETL